MTEKFPIRKVNISDDEYPVLLSEVDSAPDTLFVRGSLANTEPCVAIVGSRENTSYGAKMAQWFSETLAQAGITIVSGMAYGIDTISHRACLDAHGRTIAVFGAGIDVIYPPENDTLAERISQNGALVSEFEMGTLPLAKNFLARNRIISGLSMAVLVIEGRARSGSLSTATWASEQGREVFAVPGPKDSLLSYLPNYLIENGASIATSPKDVLEYVFNTLP